MNFFPVLGYHLCTMYNQSSVSEEVDQGDAAHGRSDQGVQEADTNVVAGGEQPVELRAVGRRRVLPRVALARIHLVQVQPRAPPVRLPWRNAPLPVRRVPPAQLVNPPRQHVDVAHQLGRTVAVVVDPLLVRVKVVS